jgi:hypothetical protein
VNVIRGLFLDNLGLKLAALLMAVLVYLNVYTDRPATIMMSFPVQVTDLPDSLSLSGPVPGTVQAELKGTGKTLIRMRLSEPSLPVSLAGVERGHFERAIATADLPIAPYPGVEVVRIIGPRMLQLEIDRMVSVRLPVAIRLEGTPAPGVRQDGAPTAQPLSVTVRGPEGALAGRDSVVLEPVRLDGRRETVRAQAALAALPEWCSAEPAVVTVVVPLRLPR